MPSHSKNPDFLVVGGGIFGLTAAIEIRKRGHTCTILNKYQIPSPNASSNDISKIVRMEYGTDTLYMDFADQCIDTWKEWNLDFNTELYHETGFLLLSRMPFETNPTGFEAASFSNLLKRGYRPERLGESEITRRYPVLSPGSFTDGFYHSRAGWVNAGLTLTKLAGYAIQLGINIIQGENVKSINTKGATIEIETDTNKFNTAHAIIASGFSTPWLVPGLQWAMRITAHPVFHLELPESAHRNAINLPVFSCDISNTGWYGFPPHPESGVLKLANHGAGQDVATGTEELPMRDADRIVLRDFVNKNMAGLNPVKIAYERKCFYTDTFDGHFWIDRHPEIEHLTVATGGSGHAFKMAPLLGRWIANAAFGRRDLVPGRFHWRKPGERWRNVEEARHKPDLSAGS